MTVDRITTVLWSDPFIGGGPGPLNTFGQTAKEDQGLPGPITVHIEEGLWEAMGKPAEIRITVEATGERNGA